MNADKIAYSSSCISLSKKENDGICIGEEYEEKQKISTIYNSGAIQ